MTEAAVAPRSNCIMSSAKLAAAGIEMTPVKAAIQCVEELGSSLSLEFKMKAQH